MIEVIAEHSVRTDLLTGGYVLDAGCVGFAFGLELARRKHPVVFIDPAPDVEPPVNAFDLPLWASFNRVALVGKGYPKRMILRMTGDLQARHLTNAAKDGDPWVDCVTLDSILAASDGKPWDVLKLDIEGAEIDVLMGIEGPIARQITCEFHLHCPQGGTDADIARVVDHLSRWYVPVLHEKSVRHCLSTPNHWDSLFVLKDLV